VYDINLIPENRYDNNTVAKTVVVVIAAVITSILLIYYGIIDPLRQRYHVEQMYRIHQSQIAGLETIAAEHTSTSTNLEQLRIRKETMRVLFEDKLPASLLVFKIDNAIPQGVHIISKNYGEGTMNLQGRAPSLLEVAALSIGLKNTGLFESVRIVSTDRDLVTGYVSFVINLKVTEAE